MVYRNGQATDLHAPIDLDRISSEKSRFSMWCSGVGEMAINLVTALMVLGALLFMVRIIKARRRPVRMILGVVSIREKRTV
jgi:hypothetical protein